MYIYVRHGGGPCRPIGDVQTDVHIVPVDSDSPIRNLLKVQTVRRALVLYRGNHLLILPTSCVVMVHGLGICSLSGAPSAVTSHVQHIDL